MAAKVVLFAAGDPGGAAAVLPVIDAVKARGGQPLVLDHGFLGERASPDIGRLILSAAESCPIDSLCFGTSLTDSIPLERARAARESGRKVVCVLDNWMNYKRRLEMDGKELLLPDSYAIMDDLARDEAAAEGLPQEILQVTGHPGLASLETDLAAFGPSQREKIRRDWSIPSDRELIVFISEPVAKDQGTGPDSSTFRGYTEHTVIPELCRALQSSADRVALVLVPHPRQDTQEVNALWQRCKGALPGLVVTGMPGRAAMLAADRVAGMASILLYEAWLAGKPVLSLQPGLRRDDLRLIGRRKDVVFVDDEAGVSAGLSSWLRQGESPPRSDLKRHALAAVRVADLLLAD